LFFVVHGFRFVGIGL